MILHSFVSSKYFDLANAGVIGLNVIMMALEYYLMPFVSFFQVPVVFNHLAFPIVRVHVRLVFR